MKRKHNQEMTGEQLFEYYNQLDTDYASIVKMLPYAAGSLEKAYLLLEKCQKENKKIIAYYPAIDLFSTETLKPIGPILDGYLYLAPERTVRNFRKTT